MLRIPEMNTVPVLGSIISIIIIQNLLRIQQTLVRVALPLLSLLHHPLVSSNH